MVWPTRLRLISALSGALLTTATPAAATTPIAEMLCSLQSDMQTRLSVQFRAERSAVGIRDKDSVVEVWTEPGTGNWTMVVTYAAGTSCIVAMGEGWEVLDNAPPPADAG
jgi:predicted methyltransferase